VEDITNIAICLSKGRAAALIEAGWTNLLMKALKVWHHDEEIIFLTTMAIATILLNDITYSKAAFIAGGVETELMTVMNMKKFRNNSSIKRYCSNSLKIMLAGP